MREINPYSKENMIIAMIKNKGICPIPFTRLEHGCTQCSLFHDHLCHRDYTIAINRCIKAAKEIFTEEELFDILI